MFITMRDRAMTMKVVNNITESALAVIECYNESVMQKEEQKLYRLLQLIARRYKRQAKL